MRRIDVVVTLSPLHKQALSVPEWEIPLLVRLHGGQVVVVGESRCENRVPDVRDEFARLERRYGRNKETLTSRVEEVYGAEITGLRKLEEAMAADLAEQATIDGPAPAEVAEASAGGKRRRSSE